MYQLFDTSLTNCSVLLRCVKSVFFVILLSRHSKILLSCDNDNFYLVITKNVFFCYIRCFIAEKATSLLFLNNYNFKNSAAISKASISRASISKASISSS